MLLRFGPPLALMALIYFLSAQPHLATDLGVWDLILRKIAHMVEYGLLWLLWWRALGYGSVWPAVAIAIGYAATDELHQSFVDGRHGTPVDVLIDSVGVGLAVLLTSRFRKRPSAPVADAAGRRDRRGRAGDGAPARPPLRP